MVLTDCLGFLLAWKQVGSHCHLASLPIPSTATMDVENSALHRLTRQGVSPIMQLLRGYRFAGNSEGAETQRVLTDCLSFLLPSMCSR
jgi:hypothetical protein